MKLLIFILFFVSCASTTHEPLRLTHKWHGNNKERLETLLNQEFPQASPPPVAIFDWDQTMIRNDVGEAVFYWMLANNKIKAPLLWKSTSPFLTANAIKELETACAVPHGQKTLNTKENVACTDLILAIYSDGKLPGSMKSAWDSKFNKDTIEPSYAWSVHLMAGYTPDEIRDFADDALSENLKNQVGTKQKLGSKQYPAYIRYYPAMKELLASLQRKGFDVWIVSASVQYIVEVAAEEVGVDSSHVIGVRPLLTPDETITMSFEGCGTFDPGNQHIITYRKGKRCWINKIIFREDDPEKMLTQPSPISFGAGDSDTDFFFLKDAMELRLVINRNKPEVMCHAYANKDKKWLINPMFIEPKEKKKEPYNCGVYGLGIYEDSIF